MQGNPPPLWTPLPLRPLWWSGAGGASPLGGLSPPWYSLLLTLVTWVGREGVAVKGVMGGVVTVVAAGVGGVGAERGGVEGGVGGGAVVVVVVVVGLGASSAAVVVAVIGVV